MGEAEKNTLVSGNAGDEKFFFLVDFPEIFSFLL